MKTFIIEYESWESYEAENEADAIKQFKSQFKDEAEIIRVLE